MKRSLSLKSEALADLTPFELLDVVGAAAPPTLPLEECLTSRQFCLTHGASCSC